MYVFFFIFVPCAFIGQVRVTPVVDLIRSIVYLIVYAIIFVSNPNELQFHMEISIKAKQRLSEGLQKLFR